MAYTFKRMSVKETNVTKLLNINLKNSKSLILAQNLAAEATIKPKAVADIPKYIEAMKNNPSVPVVLKVFGYSWVILYYKLLDFLSIMFIIYFP